MALITPRAVGTGEKLCDALALAAGISKQWEDKCDGVEHPALAG
jgi:hypothetical protein